MFRVLELKQRLLESGLLNYPINELDDAYYETHGKPPAGKYAKMLNRAAPVADKIWKQSLTVKSKFHDANFHCRYPVTDRSFYSFVELVADIDCEMQELKKEIKKAKQEKELNDYYSKFQDLLSVNMFADVLEPDISTMIDQGTQLVAQWQQETPDHPALSVDRAEVLSYYKEALKSAKKERAKLNKPREETK